MPVLLLWISSLCWLEESYLSGNGGLSDFYPRWFVLVRNKVSMLGWLEVFQDPSFTFLFLVGKFVLPLLALVSLLAVKFPLVRAQAHVSYFVWFGCLLFWFSVFFMLVKYG